MHADVVVGSVVHRTDRAAEAHGAEPALQARVTVAAGKGASRPVISQVDAALDLEDRVQPGGEFLLAPDADARGVVHELVVRLVGYRRVAAVIDLDALARDVNAAVDLDFGRQLCK